MHAQVPVIHQELFPNGVPLEEPDCRFDGSACDMTREVVAGVAVLAVILLGLLVNWYWRRWQRTRLLSMTWRIDLDDLHVVVVEGDHR